MTLNVSHGRLKVALNDLVGQLVLGSGLPGRQQLLTAIVALEGAGEDAMRIKHLRDNLPAND